MKVVLIIESNAATREALHDLLLLEWPELTVLTAATGEQGIAQAKTRKPDLILLESELQQEKQRMSGAKTAQTLRQMPETESVPLIAITVPTLEEGEQIDQLNADAWLLKPFSVDHFIEVVSPFA